MRHGKKKGRLSRRTSWRKATLKSLANDLFTYQRIETTMAKAKALRSFAEPLITLAKNDSSVTARRRAFQQLCDKAVVKSLFDELAPLYKNVPGGYTRIMPLGTRKGDGAQLAIMELTKRTISDEELLGVPKEKEKPKKKAKAAKAKEAEEKKPEEKKHVAPEVKEEEKEERAIEEVKKEKAKTEQKKVEKKGEKRGFFRRFQRKSFGPSQ
jgi:large subunit ribosomal protein L17